MTRTITCCILTLLVASGGVCAAEPQMPSRTWPQAYAVERDEAAGRLTLRTPYYVIEHDLKQGGAIVRIGLEHGRAANLLARPIETRVLDDRGAQLSDLREATPTVAHHRQGLNEIVTIDSRLGSADGQASAWRVRTTCEYRWGYVKIRKELLAPPAAQARELCVLTTTLAPSLCRYGYRDGRTEHDGAPPFSFGSNVWGKLRPDQDADPELRTNFVPRSMIFMDPGVEGLEWFVGSDLAQWDLQLTGRRGEGQCLLQPSREPLGLALSIAPLHSPDAARPLPPSSVFDFYLGVPIHDGRAHPPWLHATFNRNRGDWASPAQIERWAKSGIQTVHCHNDGDYYDDGLFWRDGAYPPYPDMDRFDRVLTDCRQAGIRTATYFSNKELHPSTEAFQEHGPAWARTDRKGTIRHNFYRPGREFGAQMCLRSGWLDFLKQSIDRVLTNHPLDGVYYDWNVALQCCNPLHEGHADAATPAQGHWDIDELLDLMEWTRSRVGPRGLVIIHNTTVPMYATENFADYVVATEWGYKKWTDRAPDLQDLPLEWNLAGAVPRGVISYGVLDRASPTRLHRLFALEALLGGVAPWPASEATYALMPLLEPLGDIGSYRFADWRNPAVRLSEPRCAAAVYSRAGETYLLLVNLEPTPSTVTCAVDAARLPYPLVQPTAASQVTTTTATGGVAQPSPAALDVRKLIGSGVEVTVPGDGAVLIHVQ